MKYSSIFPGELWLDTEGKPIQAHGGSLFYWEGMFYWYGEDKSRSLPGSGIWHWGVRCYSSQDLYNWKDEGTILLPLPEDSSSPLYPNRVMDRPHILYNQKTRKFVMWVKFSGNETALWEGQYMGVAVADSILGPFQLVKTFHPLGMNSGDFDLTMDPSDNKGYFYFERVHSELICADLTEDYMDITGYYSTHFPRTAPPEVREAPAFSSAREFVTCLPPAPQDIFQIPLKSLPLPLTTALGACWGIPIPRIKPIPPSTRKSPLSSAILSRKICILPWQTGGSPIFRFRPVQMCRI